MSEELLAQAVVTAITAATALAYDLDDVPGTLGNEGTTPTKYIEVTVSRRYGGNERGDAAPTLTGYRITTRAVAYESVTDARNLRCKAGLALENVAMSVSGVTTTQVKFESEEPIGPDDGWFTGLTSWTCVL